MHLLHIRYASPPPLSLSSDPHVELKFSGSRAHYSHAPSVASRFFEAPRRLYGCAREQVCALAPTEYRMPPGPVHVYLPRPRSVSLRAVSGSRLLSDIRIWLDNVGTSSANAPTPPRRFHAQTVPRAAAQLPGYRSLAIQRVLTA